MIEQVHFMPPKGVSMPEGLSSGDDFDMVCTFRVEENGVCMVKMGDAEMPGYGGDAGGKKPDYSDYAESLRQPDDGAPTA